MKYRILSNGIKMPLLGFGVFQIPDYNQCKQSVIDALKVGYRLIDTAEMYFNEEAVGDAIIESGIDRKEVFITTKVWFDKNDSYKRTINQVETALKKLKTNYIDLVLIHQPFGDYFSSWRALEELYDKGIIKAIGVSNFYPDVLVNFCKSVRIKPMVNQIELHPLFQRAIDIEWANKYGVAIESWASFIEGKEDIFNNLILMEIGKKYNKSVAQVILRWLIQNNIICIPKSIHHNRIVENFNIFDFELSSDDIEKISKLDTNNSYFINHQTPDVVEYLFNYNGSKK